MLDRQCMHVNRLSVHSYSLLYASYKADKFSRKRHFLTRCGPVRDLCSRDDHTEVKT